MRTRNVIRIGIVLSAVAACLAQSSAARGPLRLLRITPGGMDVKPGREIVFQFDRPMVPVGRMARAVSEIPITVMPAPGCTWRWLDASALACRLDEKHALAPSTRYRIEVLPGLVALDGAGMSEPVQHEFVTRRPKSTWQWIEGWGAPGLPQVLVGYEQQVVPESLREHLRFRMSDGTEVPVEVKLAHGDRDKIWRVSPVRELPGGIHVSLVAEQGVRSVLGDEPGEAETIVRFRTFPDPGFVGIECYDTEGDRRRIGYDASLRCDPLRPILLVFRTPVGIETLRDHLNVEPDLAGGRKDYDPWDGMVGGGAPSGVPPPDQRHRVPLPGGLRAWETYRLRADAEDIRDAFDRPLPDDLDFTFRTDHRAPNLVLTHPLSVLERDVETHVPVVPTNLDRLRIRYDVDFGDGPGVPHAIVEELPEVEDIAYRYPLRVRDWLDGRSGAVVGHVAGEPSTDDRPQWFFSQVTPFHVHVKLGHFNTLVWVTGLDDGQPVAGATVDLVWRTLESLRGNDRIEGSAVTDADGLAELPGTETIDPDAVRILRWQRRSELTLFARVRHGDDLALLPLSDDFRVDVGHWESRQRRHGHVRTFGVTAQGIYRTGDTMQYKIWVREEHNEGLHEAPADGWSLQVIDPTDKVVHQREKLSLGEFGALDGEFRVPETAAVGWYRFELRADFAPKETWQPLQVLISDFTPAPFRVATDLDAEMVRDGESLEVTTTATLHAGGPWVDAETRVTANLRSDWFRPEDPVAREFRFDTGHAERQTVHQSEGTLDDRGSMTTAFEVRAPAVAYGELTVESAVRDDRGKYVAGRSTARFSARDRFVGLRYDGWLLEVGESAPFDAIVVDDLGRVVPDVEIAFAVERRVTRAARVKGAGNAYVTEYVHEWQPAGECVEMSAAEPVSCTVTPEHAGLHRVRATVRDTLDRTQSTEMHRYAVGRGAVVWATPPGHSMEVVPETETARVGETARYLVKNPFPGAKALITIERYGVIRRWVETLEDSTAVVEFEIEPEMIPGYYLSVVVASPRVERPPSDDGDVDLGKPAFRVGYAETAVRDPYKELAIEVRPAAEVYKPRETVKIKIEGATRQGETVPMELAVAVLDESVLDLLPGGATRFDPYDGIYELRAIDLWNFNLLTRLIGIQRFEKKGASPGGGGGADPSMRSRFKFVSYWNPSVRPDADGTADIEFEVPDNLTAWRVLVMGATEKDRFGLGQATFRVNRPTEIRPALPNTTIDGDRFDARFTVMNRTDAPRTIRVEARATGDVEGSPTLLQTVETAPYRRYPVSLPVTTARNGELRFEITAGDALDADGLRVALPVRRRAALQSAATLGSTTEREERVAIEFPGDIRDDVGELAVVISPSVIGGVDGAFRYMRGYPYTCWEQKLTGAVMAAHYTALRDYLSPDLMWDAAAELPARTLALAANHQAPSGGMVYYVPDDSFVSPYLSAYTALAFRWLSVRGYEVPAGVESRLHDYLLALLRRDAFPGFFSRGMSSTVRAVALAALAPTGKVTLGDLERYRDHAERMDLFGKAHYLQALTSVEGTEAMRGEVLDMILSHADESAGKISFVEVRENSWVRILSSELRSSCAILSALASAGPEALRLEGADRLPMKLVRSITQTRDQRHHWENTQENIYCMNALIDYAGVWEAEAPRMTVRVRDGKRSMGRARFQDRRDGAKEVSRPIDEGDPGRESEVRIDRKGDGRLYWTVRMTWSPLEFPKDRINAGVDVRREYSVERDGTWVRLESPMKVQRGELVRVDLYVSLPAPRNFLVVDDPVPGGLEPVDRELATASTVDADKAIESFPPDAFWFRHDDWKSFSYTRWSFYHRELRHEAARFYSEYLSAGNYHLSYVAQVIASGTFTVPPVRVVEMYDPDIFGQGLASTLEVEDGE